MGKFEPSFLQKIKDSLDIVDVIGSYVSLKKKGKNYWGVCPFHQEKTPSFSVSSDNGLYHCFGCHAGGDVISFIQNIENISFPEAVERLAEAAHIEVPKEDMSEEDRRQAALNAKLLEATELAGAYFHNCLLKTRMGQVGLDYLKQRNVSDDTIVRFRLGFAPHDWKRLYQDFTVKKNIASQVLVQAGLVAEKNGHIYDVFRNRCIFPILNLKGETVAFGGRVMNDDKPKYLNSPETPIFNKRRLLFALYQAIPEIKNKRQVIMVEGYMDAISLHAAGITNAVASLGTAFTAEQARLLRRYADEIIFSYDMDAAGQEATKRALAIAGEAGLKLRVLQLPSGKDPDEFLTTHGTDAYLFAIAHAKDALDYLLETALRTHDAATLEGQQHILQDMFGALVAEDNSLRMNAFIRKMSRVMRLDEGLIRSEAVKYAKEHRVPIYISLKQTEFAPSTEKLRTDRKQRLLEEGFLRYSLYRGKLPSGWSILRTYVFVDTFHEKIFRILEDSEGSPFHIDEVAARLEQEDMGKWASLIMKEDVGGIDPVEMYIRPLKKMYLQNEYRIHTKLAAELWEKDPEASKKEQFICIQLNREIRELSDSIR